VHEADEPDAVGDLFDTNQLASEDGAEVDFAALEANMAAVGDQRGSVMEWIFEIAQSLVGSGRFFVELRGRPHVQGLMWPITVVIVDKVIEARLLHEEVLGGGLGGLFL